MKVFFSNKKKFDQKLASRDATGALVVVGNRRLNLKSVQIYFQLILFMVDPLQENNIFLQQKKVLKCNLLHLFLHYSFSRLWYL